MSELLAAIQAQAEQLSQWRRHFHQYPEKSLAEYQTAQKIREILTELGIAYETIGETGTLASIEGTAVGGSSPRSPKQILLRADIDALEISEASEHDFPSKNPGLMHACGHDGHTAALLGAAAYLVAHRSAFQGRILLAFQQAEEIGAGAKQFVASGLLEGVDQAFGIHVDPSLPLGQAQVVAGPTMASCDIFTIEVIGRSAHVARPHEGIDALAAGANIVTELQHLVARMKDPMEAVVIGIGKFTAGSRYNIVANHAKLEGTLRTLSYSLRQDFLKRIEATAQAIASVYGARIEFTNYPAAAPVINQLAASQRAQIVAEQLLGAENVITTAPATMGADDFADILEVIDGTYIRVGVSNSLATSYGLHHEKFDLAEEALAIMAAFHVQYALDFLAEP